MSGKYAFTKGLKEVRFLLCQTGETSNATRSFLARAYPTMKKNNPSTPIMIREAAGTQPQVFARYDFGKEKSELLAGLSDKEIEEKVTGLVNLSQARWRTSTRLSSPGTGQDAAAPSDGSYSKNMPPTNDSDSKNKPPSTTRKGHSHATRKDHGHHEAETEKTDEESDYEFADVSDPGEQHDPIMNKMMNMDEEEYQAYKKKHPWPGLVGPEVAFKVLRELYDDSDSNEEEKAKEAAPSGSQPTKKQ
ncbi:hypothetical protein V502_07225 [Pseudogymnoascus sp. VKM F-4520 (FW-2644)]|nr:hypothetical protein V502_07225 [Pseudogymnoascus sp. VKM F-4520 (FW-2644)]